MRNHRSVAASSFRKTAHRCIVRVTQSNWVKNVIFVFPVLPGSAEAQVIWGGIVKCLLIAYFIGNISAKKYENPFMYVKVIANERWDVFWDTVYILATPRLSDKGLLNGLLLLLPAPRRICNCHCLFVCLFVSNLRKKFQTDLHEIFREGWQWLNGQMIIFLVAKNDFIFWWQSGSRSAY